MLKSVLRLNPGNEGKSKLVRLYTAATQKQPAAERNDNDWNSAIPYEKLPGPSLFSFMRSVLPGGKYFGLSMVELHRGLRRDYGGIMKLPGVLGRKEIVVSYEPTDYELVFRTEGQWPVREGFDVFTYYRKVHRADVFKELNGLVTEQGESWHKMRTIVNPVMMQPKTVKLYVPCVDEVAQDFINIIKSQRDDKLELPADFGHQMNRWALESIGCIALDTRLGVLDKRDSSAESETIIENVHKIFELMFQLDVQPSIWKFYKTSAFDELMRVFDTLTELIMKYVDQGIERIEKTGSTQDHEMGVLEKLLKVNRHVAAVMAFDMILAGVDTTSSATISSIYELAKNPEKQQKMREELKKIMPSKNTPLTTEKMANLPYLRACIKEAMRIHPVVSGNARKTGTDLILQGYQIPKGVNVAMGSVVLQADDTYFPKANEFLPERWLKSGGADSAECPHVQDANKFIFLPFGFGSRSCIGRRFAELEIEVMVAKMIRQFEVEWHYDDIKYLSSMINTPMGDLKFRLKDVEN